jgi:hypothetical protein
MDGIQPKELQLVDPCVLPVFLLVGFSRKAVNCYASNEHYLLRRDVCGWLTALALIRVAARRLSFV